jgi:hypothetical protein
MINQIIWLINNQRVPEFHQSTEVSLRFHLFLRLHDALCFVKTRGRYAPGSPVEMGRWVPGFSGRDFHG